MMKENDYKIFNINNQKFLFTSKGFNETPYSDMIVREFKNEDFDFFICTLDSKNVVLFSNGLPLVEFLFSKAVAHKTYDVTAIEYQEKPIDYDNVTVSLTNGLKLLIGVSHLDGQHGAVIKDGDTLVEDLIEDGNNLDTEFPRWKQLDESDATLEAEGEVGDTTYIQFDEQRKDASLATFAVLILVVIAFALIVVLSN